MLAQLESSDTLKAATHKITEVDGGRRSNTVLLPVDPVKIGASEITVSHDAIRAGVEASFTITWTHPISNCRALDTLDLRLADDNELALWVRFTEAVTTTTISAHLLEDATGISAHLLEDAAGDQMQDASTFSLLDRNGQVVATGKPADEIVFETDQSQLILARTAFAGSGAGPEDRGLTLTVSARFKKPAAGRTYNTEIYVTDDTLDSRGPEVAGQFTVLWEIYLPQISR